MGDKWQNLLVPESVLSLPTLQDLAKICTTNKRTFMHMYIISETITATTKRMINIIKGSATSEGKEMVT